MKKKNVKVLIPKGYKADKGEQPRVPTKGEHYLGRMIDGSLRVFTASDDNGKVERIILKKKAAKLSKK